MTAASGTAHGLGVNLPESIPLPRLRERASLRRELLLLLVCAGFAAAVALGWGLLERTWLAGSPEQRLALYRRIRDLAGPFLTLYLAVRIHRAVVNRYELRLVRHRLALSHILDTSVDGIITLDPEDCISTWNRGAENIFGYREEEIVGRHASLLYPPEQESAIELAAMREAVEKAGVLRAHSAERITKDGRRIRTEVSATVLRDASGRYAGRASIVRDVTERARIRDELARRESLAAIGEMAAAVAHEIKNPLAGIGGAVEVIGRSFGPRDTRAEVIREIQGQVRRLDRTLRDLLVFARPTHPRLATVALREFTARILRVLAEEPVLKPHQVVAEVPAGIEVRADPQLLENIVVNLLLNAGQALGGKPGRVTLRAEEDADSTRVSVRDTGPGIPEEVLSQLFKPFFSTRTRGTGLGLTIVRKFVLIMGGRIEVDTRHREGTTFTVVLPRPKREVR